MPNTGRTIGLAYCLLHNCHKSAPPRNEPRLRPEAILSRVVYFEHRPLLWSVTWILRLIVRVSSANIFHTRDGVWIALVVFTTLEPRSSKSGTKRKDYDRMKVAVGAFVNA